MKPYTQTINRLYRGLADIRDYLLEKSRKMNQTVIFERMDNGERMTITPDRFNEGMISPTIFRSKEKSGQLYRIVSFKWEADKNIPKYDYRSSDNERIEVLSSMALASIPKHHLDQMRAIFNKKA